MGTLVMLGLVGLALDNPKCTSGFAQVWALSAKWRSVPDEAPCRKHWMRPSVQYQRSSLARGI